MNVRTIDSDSPLGDKLMKVLAAVMKSYDSSIVQLGLNRESNASVPVLFTNLILLSMYTQRNVDVNNNAELFQEHGRQILDCLSQIDDSLKEIPNA